MSLFEDSLSLSYPQFEDPRHSLPFAMDNENEQLRMHENEQKQVHGASSEMPKTGETIETIEVLDFFSEPIHFRRPSEDESEHSELNHCDCGYYLDLCEL